MDRDGERVRPGRDWFAFVFPRLGLVWGDVTGLIDRKYTEHQDIERSTGVITE